MKAVMIRATEVRLVSMLLGIGFDGDAVRESSEGFRMRDASVVDEEFILFGLAEW